jgi:glycosyltransferase involved in cell wall biosynthesis
LTRALDLLLRDSVLRQSMASAALRHSRHFDWDRIAGQWIELFREVAIDRRVA